MNAQDIVQLIANQGLGNDNPSLSDKEVYLRYLDLAHKELYRSAKPLDEDAATQSVDIEIIDGVGALPAGLFHPVSAIDVTNKRKLTRKTRTWLEDNTTPLLSETGVPSYYYYTKQFIYPYPKSSITLRLRYIPNATPITLETTEDQIPYPLEYHQVLVDGALHYLFQGEGGFKSGERRAEALARWQKGKNALRNHYVQDITRAPVRDY